jgi:hypothetical protein
LPLEQGLKHNMRQELKHSHEIQQSQKVADHYRSLQVQLQYDQLQTKLNEQRIKNHDIN